VEVHISTYLILYERRSGLLDIKDVINQIFKLDERIRYVAILNLQFKLLESKMRQGVASLTPAQTDRDFMEAATPLMVDSAGKLRPFCGSIRRITVLYDKVLLTIYRTAIHLVVLSLEPGVDQALLDEIGAAVRKLELSDAKDENAEAP
jgi:hypothetical protein